MYLLGIETNYTTAEFAAFQKKWAKTVIDNDEIYGVAAWAREHAKSVVSGLFLPMYLKFTGKMQNMLLVSHSFDNACELIMPIMLNLEANQRIINDYGTQKSFRGWEVGKFVTNDGCSFRAIGAGQSPRGTRNEEKRPDMVLIDDIDTDEESHNQKRIDKKWAWIEQALFPTMSISGRKRFLFVGNIISRESIIVKASRVADFFQKVNILNRRNQPSWKERYSMKQVNYMMSKISYASGQKEYFNNPIIEGTVFSDLRWGKVPPLSRFKFVMTYGDPAPSNQDTKNNCMKSAILVGEYKGKFYIINCFLEHVTNKRYIEFFHDLKAYVNQKTTLYNYMENNSLQDPFYEQVYRPLMVDVNNEKSDSLYILPDERRKPDKFTRIEGTLEPLHRMGFLIFNIDEKENPHMKRLAEQFETVNPKLTAQVDGPDATEGGVWMIKNKLKQLAPITVARAKRTKYKY